MGKLKTFFKNKFVLGTVALLIIGYFAVPALMAKKAVPQYRLASVQKGTLTTTISGSGQVSASSQIDIKPESSGTLVSLDVIVGQNVTAGQRIGALDQRSSQVSIKQAQAGLLSAQASYDKLVSGAAAVDVKISQVTVDQAQDALNTALQDLTQTQQTTAQNIEQAQKTVDDLNTTAAATSSVQSIATAQQNLENTKKTGQQNIENKRSTLVTNIEDKLNAVKSALDAIESMRTNDSLKGIFAAKDQQLIYSLDLKYDEANGLLITARTSLDAAKSANTDNSVHSALKDATAAINRTTDALNDAYSGLQATILTSDLSQSQLDGFKSNISSNLNSVNSALSALQSAEQAWNDAILSYSTNIAAGETNVSEAQTNYDSTLTKAKDALTNAKLSATQQVATAQAKVESSRKSLESAQIQLEKTTAPAQKDEVKSAQAQLLSAQAQLESAQLAAAKNIITSPIAGKIAKLSVQKGDQASGSAAVATVLANQKVALIQFNEVDTAKLQLGQDAELTFDALPDITLKGKVSEIEGVGVVTQGVVDYAVKIAFDSPDERIKSGMSVSSVVTTSTKPDVLLVPNEAVKSQGDRSYVEMLPNAPKPSGNQRGALVSSAEIPTRKFIEIGDANDTQTEVRGGLKEGDEVIVLVVNGTATSTAAAAGGGFRLFGGGGGTGAAGGARTGGGGAAARGGG